jgi:signal transduction histidine kinase
MEARTAVIPGEPRTEHPTFRAAGILQQLAETIAPLTGEAFFRSAVQFLSGALGVQAVFVAECVDYPATRLRILAEWDRGRFTAPREFALAGTPCDGTVGEGRTTCLPDGLLDRFPHYAAKERTSYLGVPVFDPTDGRVIGHVAVWDRKPIRGRDIVGLPVFRIFVSRIGAELRRKRSDDTMWMIAEATAPLSGPAFFRTLAHYLAKTLSFREVFITECVDAHATRVRMLSHWVGDGFADNDEYDLAGTPCEITVRERRTTFIGERLETMFACCAGDQAYLGLPIFDAGGNRVIGHIAFYDVNPRRDAIVDNPVFRILASRAGAELLRKRAEEEARRHLHSLAHVTRLFSMNEMASAIAHEVNQPLTAVVTYTQACMRLLRSGEATTDEVLQWMERVGAQAERASRIIRHLRTFVRKDDAQLLPLQVNPLVDEVAQLVRPDARQSEVEVLTELAEGLPEIVADGIQIQQVLVNLVRNAVEAINGAGCERREVRLTTCLRADGAVQLRVEDTGPGFDDAKATRLFEPFYSTKSEGMGIGLSISRSIVEAHGGQIHAARAPGGGARFTVALPATVDRDQCPPREPRRT